MTTDAIYVPAHAVPQIRAALDKAAAADRRHAARLNLPVPAAPVLTVGEERQVRECNACRCQTTDTEQWLSMCCTAPARLLTLMPVTISAPRPTCGAWELLAVVEGQPNDFEGKRSPNLLRGVPGSTEGLNLDAWRWGDATNCDHCIKSRRRNETFLVLSLETGEIKQVGRQCLAAFLGDQTYESIIRRLAWRDLLDDSGAGMDDGEGGWGGRWGHPDPDIETVLALTACVIRNDGWLSKTAARERFDGSQATATQVNSLLHPPREGTKEFAEWRKEVARLAPQPSDMEHATAALAWVRTITPRSDYDWTIHTAGRLTHVAHMGVVCSIVPAYTRMLGREIEKRTRRAEAPPSRHIGTVNEKLSVTGICESARAVQGERFTSTSITVVADDGTVVQWWKSGIVDEVIAGRRVTITGKVKKHGAYDGRDITTLTRCKLEVLPALAEAN